MGASARILSILAVSALAIALVWVLVGASSYVDRKFPGFLVLDNGVVASAGLAHWPATASGQIFQHTIESYDGRRFTSSESLHTYLAELPVGTPVIYTFRRGSESLSQSIHTRVLTPTDAVLLYGATLLAALAFLGVAIALLYVAPRDPATLGSALSFGITGVFALSAIDLYWPYHFFRVHAVAECFLGAGTLHMALTFPYRRAVSERHPWIIPSAYAASTVLGLVTAVWLYNPDVYVVTHRLAIALAGLAFMVMVLTQVASFARPRDYEARQRVTILAMGTFATVTPGFALLLASALSGGTASENFIGWTGAFFPISVAYAVLRSDALQVDSIIRRTVTYAILTLVVGAAYAGLVGGVEFLVRDQIDIPRWVFILAFSAFCTVGVLPLRDRMQSWIDRMFFRAVYDFRVIIEETSAVLARLTDLDDIKQRIEEAAEQALQPEDVELVFYGNEIPAGDDVGLGDAEHAPIVDLESGGIAVPFRTSSRTVAVLILGRRLSGRFYSPEDRALLQVLANQGAIAIENAQALRGLKELNRTLEKRVLDRTAELASTVEQLTDTQVQLVQAERLAAVGELAAGVAHEVNNPLNFARNSLRALDMLVDDLLNSIGDSGTDDLETQEKDQDPAGMAEDIKELVGILGSGLDRTARLVSDLRDFARPTSDRPDPFDPVEAIGNVVQLTGSTARAADVALAVEAELPGGIRAAVDQSSFGQVVLNLVKNAIDACEDTESASVQIRLSCSEDRRAIRMEIRDNGQGMSPEILERAFEPFFTTKEAGKGTGLGLPMCQRILQENGGTIDIQSQLGEGTLVTISIPSSVELDSP